MIYKHISVMLDECIQALGIKPNGTYVDGTAGLGGHSSEILKSLDKGRLICFDKDDEALRYCKERFGDDERVTLVKSDFRFMKDELASLGISAVDGILLDLGVSSLQLDKPERGFSYRFDAALDMRMDNSAPLTAYKIVNEWSHDELKRILYQYGEERYAPLIASAIIRNRPIDSTVRLSDVIASSMPSKARKEAQHPAKRSFQAIRIAVNDELGALRQVMDDCIDLLGSDGRIAVLTFHSLEDRMVKTAFSSALKGCTCPPSFPVCNCGFVQRIVSTDRVFPSDKEIEGNSRSSCAKLRVAVKK